MHTIDIGIISLFPNIFLSIKNYGTINRALKKNLLNIHFWNPRNYSFGTKKCVDDRPYGGGPGMVMKALPIHLAIQHAKKKIGENTKIIYLSPQGRRLDQNGVKQLFNNKKMIFVCGRYKGIDERLISMNVGEEWSIGDYILSGGEIAAIVIIDAISRYIPGVLNNEQSINEDSFSNGLLDYPNYTRPEILNGIQIPMVLKSGNHDQIRIWRLKQSLGKTWIKKPKLLKNLSLNTEEKKLLSEFKKEKTNFSNRDY